MVGVFFLVSDSDQSKIVVTKVLDGDTVLISGGQRVRLLGIDADERGYPCYDEAKDKLEDLVLGKEVRLESDSEDKDQYDRLLRYIFLNDNISVVLVKKGYAVARIQEPNTKYEDVIIRAEQKAMEKEVGCKWGEVLEEDEPEVKLDKDVIHPCDAGDYIGEEVVVQGRVEDSYFHEESETVFLNFGGAYPNNCFTGVIFEDDLSKFSNLEDYGGEVVKLKGVVEMYKGKPEIIIESPDQIQ